MRLRAIAACLWFGLMPWQVYEAACHYGGLSYFKHLLLNARQACVWATGKETEEDTAFEREVNTSWRSVNWVRLGGRA